MPIVTLPVPDTKDSITRPVTSGIIDELFDILGWKKSDVNVFYPDEMNTVQQHNTAIEGQDQFSSRMPGKSQIWVEVDDEFAEDAFFQNETYKEEEPFIFADDELRVWLKPTHTACEVTITFRYKAEDRTQAERWRNAMRARMNNYQDLNHHLLEYHYLIPRVQVYILQELHKLREANHGLKEDFGGWFKRCGSPRFTKVATLDGEEQKTNLAIAEKQMRVFGFWDFSLAPERGSKDSQNETWTVGFSYKFRYERPTNLTLVYPLMIHNQLLPVTLRPTTDRLSNVPQGRDRSFTLTGYLFEQHTAARQHDRMHARRGVVVPRFDEWVAPTTVPRTMRLLQVLCQLDDNDTTDLFRLDDYENLEYTMEGEVMDFLADEHPWVNTPRASVFNVSLYNQYGQLQPRYLQMNQETHLTTTEPLNPRNYYHVRLSIHENWGDLLPEALRRLFQRPGVVDHLLRHLGYDDLLKWIRNHGGWENYWKGRDGLIDDIVGKMSDKPPIEDPRMRTVQTYSIITYRDDPKDPRYYGELLRYTDGSLLDPNRHRY